MNVLIGIGILLTLSLADVQNIQCRSQAEILATAAWVLALTVLPMLVACIQVLSFSTALHKPNTATIIRQQTAVHSICWLLCSLAIAALPWASVVRVHWGLNERFLLDELVIVCPMLLALIVSWWIQSFYQVDSLHAGTISNSDRWQFVWLRCRLYLLMVLLPIFGIILVGDLYPVFAEKSPLLSLALVSGAVILLAMGMPYLVRAIWDNHSISDSEGREPLLRYCHKHRMQIDDIRIWETGNQVSNALIVGILPKWRLLMLTDLLLRSFTANELNSVLRHEAGHTRFWHLPIRIAFVFAPAVIMALARNNTWASTAAHSQLTNAFQLTNVPLADFVIGVAFIIYVLAVTCWLSRQMEFEADLYAIGALRIDNDHNRSEEVAESEIRENAQSMNDALLRFAQQNPNQWSQRSFTHPSLEERVQFIKNCVRKPQTAQHFRRRFVIAQIAISIAWIVTGLAVASFSAIH